MVDGKTHSISRMDVIFQFIIEYNYSPLIQYEILKKPVTYIVGALESSGGWVMDPRNVLSHIPIYCFKCHSAQRSGNTINKYPQKNTYECSLM